MTNQAFFRAAIIEDESLASVDLGTILRAFADTELSGAIYDGSEDLWDLTTERQSVILVGPVSPSRYSSSTTRVACAVRQYRSQCEIVVMDDVPDRALAQQAVVSIALGSLLRNLAHNQTSQNKSMMAAAPAISYQQVGA